MKRFVSFILAIVILTSIYSPLAMAQGKVMEIDGFFGDFKLQVENRGFPHKEPFLYDGELWVPMRDLAQALGIGYSFDSIKRNIYLNSHGKIGRDYDSLEPLVYQKGYEIQASIRRIAELQEEVAQLEGRNPKRNSEMPGVVRNIRVGFSGLDVFLDGQQVALDRQPLIYNNDVYVSLLALSPILYITPEFEDRLINIDGNAILLDKAGYNLEGLITFRQLIEENLRQQLARLEKKREILMDVKIPYEEVKTLRDMEWYLNKHLGYIEDLPLDIRLRAGNNSWYYIDVSFSRRHLARWRNLSPRQVEAYIWDVFVAINSLYDEDAKIQGQVSRPGSSRRNFVEFDTHMRNLEFKFLDSGLDMGEKIDTNFIEDYLNRHYGSYSNVGFDYRARVSGYDLELVISPYNYRFYNWSLYSKIGYLTRISQLIGDYYPHVKVNGLIEYGSREGIQFLVDGGKLRSPELERETEELLNQGYGSLTLKGLRIPISYKLQALTFDDYKLLVDMDFDINSQEWDRTMEDELGAFLQDVVSEIVALWDMNVFLEAYDKNQHLVKELVISQDLVQMVAADPVSGEVVEGSTVELYSNTPGARIYYTLDGSRPMEGNRISYSGPIVINQDTTIRAYASKDGMKDSPISTFEYQVIDDDNMAGGLEDLIVEGGLLKPEFDRRKFDYSINLGFATSSISLITRAAAGRIEIDGEPIESGARKKIDLKPGENKVTIIHREDGKKDRVYTIVINRNEEGRLDVRLDSNYIFTTSIIGAFRGELASDTIRNFNGYSVELLSRLGKHYNQVEVNSDGSFEITGFDIGWAAKIIGYKYKILDPDGHLVDEGDL